MIPLSLLQSTYITVQFLDLHSNQTFTRDLIIFHESLPHGVFLRHQSSQMFSHHSPTTTIVVKIQHTNQALQMRVN
jgi:hypothetical protein